MEGFIDGDGRRKIKTKWWCVVHPKIKAELDASSNSQSLVECERICLTTPPFLIDAC